MRHLLAMVLDGTSDAAAAGLCQGEVGVEGCGLVRVLTIAQPRHAPQRHAQLWCRLTATYHSIQLLKHL